MNDFDPVVVGGRYELGEMLGRGGMAEVRQGVDRRLGRTVAVKRLRTDLASDATFQARFRREAQSAASLNHPAIVAVYDTGEELSTDGTNVAQPYIVMECVEGRTLRDVLREGRKILPERALEIVSDVLAALDYSHRAGIIHRDIKPGNVMLTPQGEVKVMDFGIARAVSDASSTMTQTAAVVGTAQYLSPEQARGETVDSRSDVYSAGCLLYELLTGRPPFIGDSPVAVAYQHVREPAVPPSHLDDTLDDEIDAIVMKSLAKRVDDRYQSAAQMRADIERYLAGDPISLMPAAAADYTRAQEVEPPTGPTQRPVAETLAPPPPPEEPRRRSNTPTIIAILLTLLLIGAVAYVVNQLAEPVVEQVQVPNFKGKTLEQAQGLLATAGLKLHDPVDYEYDREVAKDRVVDQWPYRDVYVDPGSEVTLTVSKGMPVVTVPYVKDLLRADAAAQLKAVLLEVKAVEVDSDEPPGTVVDVQPPQGQEVEEGSTVTISYAKGPVTIPDVRGLTKREAMAKLKAAGFVPQQAPWSETTEPKGTVVNQSQFGPAPQNTTVVIYVSTYVEPPPEPTPSVEPTPSLSPTDLPTVTPPIEPTPSQ